MPPADRPTRPEHLGPEHLERRGLTPCRHGAWTNLLDRLLDGIVPPKCAGCGRTGSVLCSRCAAALRPAPDRRPPPNLDALAGVFLYRGAAERIVARAKYRHDVRLLDLLGVTLGPLLDTVLECAPTAPAAVLTWIPGTPRHRRQRGGDPAATLARSAVTASIRPPTDRPSVEQLLRRHDDRPQADRDRAGRLVGPQLVSVVPAPQFVIVLDDVCTTGASLDAAGRTLRQAGAQRVVGLALAVRN